MFSVLTGNVEAPQVDTSRDRKLCYGRLQYIRGYVGIIYMYVYTGVMERKMVTTIIRILGK